MCPRLEHITLAQVEQYLQEWHDAGAVIWYEVDGEMFLYCVGFKRQQVGLRYEREAASRYPAPPTPELVRSDSATSPRNGMERNRIEGGSADLTLNLLKEVQDKVAENESREQA